MQLADQIIHARWIVASHSPFAILENHALAITDGKIAALLPAEDMTRTYTTKTTVHLQEHALIPGLINAHTHVGMNYLRGMADDLPLMDWLTHHIWPAEQKWVSHEFVGDASLFAMAEMIRAGTTCFSEMYFFPEATAAAADTAGLRGQVGMTVIEVPTGWAKTAEECLAHGLDFLGQYRHHPRIRPMMAPHAPYTVSDASFERIQSLAEEHDLKISLHLHETEAEVSQSLEKTGMRPIRRLHEIGLLSPRLIAIHMTALDNEDLQILAKTRPAIVHCPESNMKLASGACPVDTLLREGLTVALGTDSVASNNDLDMISEMRSAALLSKLVTRNPEALPADTVLGMATWQGAKALGMDSVTGSITPGKMADLAAIRLDALETLPLYHPLSQIVYAAGRHQVTDVWVEGRQLLKDRQLTTLDEAALKAKALAWQKKLAE